jgi:hypothetical protein
MTRGDSAIRGRDASRWEAAASVKTMQQPAGQEVHEAMAGREATEGCKAETPADRRRQQKANRRWEVDVVHQEAGAR